MNYYVYFFFYMLIMSLILLSINYYYVLNSMISLEFLVISFSLIMFTILVFLKMEIYVLIYLVFSVLESVFGLSLIILLNRFHNKDFVKFMNLGQ